MNIADSLKSIIKKILADSLYKHIQKEFEELSDYRFIIVSHNHNY